ncbi:MAG TPA: hypothetical protein VGI39_45030 [Polyangiaceae bacterium]
MRVSLLATVPLLTVSLVLAACGGAVTSSSGSSAGGGAGDLSSKSDQIASVTFSTRTSIPANPPPNVHVTVNDATRAQALYQTLLSQPAFPPETISCPADFGVLYSLSFLSSTGAMVSVAELKPNGCEPLTVSSPGTPEANLWGLSVWSALAQDLGIAEAEIYPYLPPMFSEPPPVEDGGPVLIGDAGVEPIDAPVTGDASVTPTVDGGPVIYDDGGVFTCGTGTLTCDGQSEICAHVIGGAPPGVDFYECKPIPAACAMDVSCNCVLPAMKNEAAASCTADGSDLTLIFAVP